MSQRVCSLCKSPGVNKSTCPLNTNAKKPNSSKHPLSIKSLSGRNREPDIDKANTIRNPYVAEFDDKNDLIDIGRQFRDGYLDYNKALELIKNAWPDDLTFEGESVFDFILEHSKERDELLEEAEETGIQLPYVQGLDFGLFYDYLAEDYEITELGDDYDRIYHQKERYLPIYAK